MTEAEKTEQDIVSLFATADPEPETQFANH